MAISKTSLTKIGTLLAIASVLVALFILFGFGVAHSSIIWFLVVVNFVSGPACLFFYLIELKKGVFKQDGNIE